MNPQQLFFNNIKTKIPPPSSYTYATWNPLDKSTNVTLSGGNLTANGTTTGAVRSNLAFTADKTYIEILINTLGFHQLGLGNGSANLETQLGGDNNSWSMWQDDGNCEHGGSSVGNNGGSSNGSLMGLAYNKLTNVFEIYRDNILLSTSFSGVTGTIYVMYCNGGSEANVTANFGQSSFVYTPPAGYVGLYS